MRAHGYLAFVAGMFLTFWTCLQVLEAQDEQIGLRFRRDTDKVANDTRVRLQTYFDMVLGLKGVFALSGTVTRAQFGQLVRDLHLAERYPGFQAVQFVQLATPEQLAQLTATVRTDTSIAPKGHPDFTIHPALDAHEHYIIAFVEPMAGNEAAFGLDLAALAPHRKAIEQGRDSGDVVATGRVILVQDSSKQPGFVARAPLYRPGAPLAAPVQRRAAFSGMVAIVFRVDALMRALIEPALLADLTIHIDDVGATDAPSVPQRLFDNGGAAQLPGLRALARLDVGQRRWELRFGAVPGERYGRAWGTVALIGAAGSLISELFAAVLQGARRSRAMAAQLRAALDEQRAFQDSANVGIALFADGVIVRCNRGLEELSGYARGELIGQPSAMLVRRALGQQRSFAPVSDCRFWQGELELVRKDSSAIWCLASGKALQVERLVDGAVWVIQDISAAWKATWPNWRARRPRPRRRAINSKARWARSNRPRPAWSAPKRWPRWARW